MASSSGDLALPKPPSEVVYLVAHNALQNARLSEQLLRIFRCACSHGDNLQQQKLSLELFRQFCVDSALEKPTELTHASNVQNLTVWPPNGGPPSAYSLRPARKPDDPESNSDEDTEKYPGDTARRPTSGEAKDSSRPNGVLSGRGSDDADPAQRQAIMLDELDAKISGKSFGSGFLDRQESSRLLHEDALACLVDLDLQGGLRPEAIPAGSLLSTLVPQPLSFYKPGRLLSRMEVDELFRGAARHHDVISIVGWVAIMVQVSQLFYPKLHEESPTRAFACLLQQFLHPFVRRLAPEQIPLRIPYKDYPIVNSLVLHHEKPLERVFEFYAQLRPRKNLEVSLLFFEELVHFLKDLTIFPRLLSHGDAYWVMDNFNTNRLPEPTLDFPSFVDALMQLSFLVFLRHPNSDMFPTIASKWHAMMELVRPLYARRFGVALVDDSTASMDPVEMVLHSMSPDRGPHTGFKVTFTGRGFEPQHGGKLFVRFGTVMVEATVVDEFAIAAVAPPQATTEFTVSLHLVEDVWTCQVNRFHTVEVEGSNDGGATWTYGSNLKLTYEDPSDAFSFANTQAKLQQIFVLYTSMDDPYNTTHLYLPKWQKFRKDFVVDERIGRGAKEAADNLFHSLAVPHEVAEGGPKHPALTFAGFLQALVTLYVQAEKEFPEEHVARLTSRDLWLGEGFRLKKALARPSRGVLSQLQQALAGMNLLTSGPQNCSPNLSPRSGKVAPLSGPEGRIVNIADLDRMVTLYLAQQRQDQVAYMLDKWVPPTDVQAPEALRSPRPPIERQNGPTLRRSQSFSTLPPRSVLQKVLRPTPLSSSSPRGSSTAASPRTTTTTTGAAPPRGGEDQPVSSSPSVPPAAEGLGAGAGGTSVSAVAARPKLGAGEDGAAGALESAPAG
eukprot:RCo045489